MNNPTEIDHLGIAVSSLDEGVRFYQALGLTVSHRETVPAEQVLVAMLPAGPGTSAPRIELLEATAEDSVIAKFIQKRGPGLHHIAMRVDSLDAAVERMKSQGARL